MRTTGPPNTTYAPRKEEFCLCPTRTSAGTTAELTLNDEKIRNPGEPSFKTPMVGHSGEMPEANMTQCGEDGRVLEQKPNEFIAFLS